MSCNSEVRRRQISTLVGDVADAEQSFRDRGVELADEDEWMMLRDIVARIERKLLANMPSQPAQSEAAE
jgi:hypothetical protein